MRRRIDRTEPSSFHDQSKGGLDHTALAFIVSDECWEQRQTRGVGAGPTDGTKSVRAQIPQCAIRCLPSIADTFCLPGFPELRQTGSDRYGMPIAAIIVHVLLPLLKREAA